MIYLGFVNGIWTNEDVTYTYLRAYYDSGTDSVITRYFADSESSEYYEGQIDGETDGFDIRRYSEYKYCEGNSLVKFNHIRFWPYFYKVNTGSHFLCAGVACDVMFLGEPEIIAPVEAGGQGGIRVLAQSTHGAVRYVLEGESIFFLEVSFSSASNDTGEFVVYPGVHTIWAVDEINCKTKVVVSVPYWGTESYGLKFWAQYNNLRGETTRIEIHKKGYTGSNYELQAGSPPLIIKWGESGDPKNKPIVVSTAQIELISFDDYEFLEFYTNNTQSFRVIVKRIPSNEIMWWGYITPEFYGEPYLNPPYRVSISCNDGLGDLQNIPFAIEGENNEYTPYNGLFSHLYTAKIILNKIKSSLPINIAINTYEENQGYDGGPQILRYTTQETIETELQAGVRYFFKVTGNSLITIYYGNDLLFTPSSFGEFDYTPTVSGGIVSVDIVSGSAPTIEIYETHQSTFDQVFAYAENYYKNGTMSCFEVLEEQLKPYGARLYQSKGAWNIVRFDQANDEYNRIVYDGNLNFISIEIFQPVYSIRKPHMQDDGFWVHESRNLTLSPGYKSQTVVHDLGYVPNLIKSGEITPDDFTEGKLDGFETNVTGLVPDLFYSMVQIDNEGNYGISLNGWSANMYFTRVDYFLILTGSQNVPSGLQGGLYQEGELVLILHETDATKTGIYYVQEDTTYTNEPWPLYIGHAKIVKYRDLLFSFSRYIPPGPITGTPPPRPVTLGLLENTIENYSLSTLQLPSIVSYPISLEYKKGDKVRLTIRCKYVQNNNIPHYLAAQIKLGDSYLAPDMTWVSWFDFVEFQLVESRKEFIENTIEFFVPSEHIVYEENITVKLWMYKTASVRTPGGGRGGGRGRNPSEDVIPGELEYKHLFSDLIIDKIVLTYLPDGVVPPLEKKFVQYNLEAFNHIPDYLNVMYGDLPDVLNNQKIYSHGLYLSNGQPTKNWKRKEYSEGKAILQILDEMVLAHNRRNMQILTGTIYKLMDFSETIYDPMNPNRVFMPNMIEWDEMEATSSVELIEMLTRLDSAIDAAFTRGFSVGFKS